MLPSLPDRVLECLTRLEYGSLGCGDLHGLLGAGGAAGAGGPLFDLKGAEADQLHLLAGLQSSLDRGDERSQSGVAVLLERPLVSAMAAINSVLFIVCSPRILVFSVGIAQLYRICGKIATYRV